MAISPSQLDAVVELAKHHGWRLVVLFGSTAREGAGRDIDLAILPVSVPDLLDEGRWFRELEDIFSPKPVDLLLLTIDTSPLVRFEAFRDGHCLYEAEPGLFDREQDRAFFLYADTEHLRRTDRKDKVGHHA